MNNLIKINAVSMLLAVAIVTMAVSCNYDDESDGTYSFEVQTTVGTATNYYSGLTLGFGLSGNATALVEAVVDKDGKATFSIPTDFGDYAGKDVWFGVDGMVKFFHTVSSAEADGKVLTLPDKDAGSIVKDKVNDWIVALYIGINKDGEKNGVPIYWATGNLITEKTNAPGASSQVVYRIADEKESIEETKEDGSFMRVVEGDVIKLGVADAYANMPAGTKWNMYNFGDKTGLRMYDPHEDVKQYVFDTKQMSGSEIVYNISGNKDYDIATQLGGLWRTPTAGKSGSNEFAALEDNSEEYATLKPDFTIYNDNGTGIKYDYVVTINGKEICTNALKLPFSGYRHANEDVGGIGLNCAYWSSTADPTMTPIFNQPDMDVDIYSVAFNLGYFKQQVVWVSHPRTSCMCIRPVTE